MSRSISRIFCFRHRLSIALVSFLQLAISKASPSGKRNSDSYPSPSGRDSEFHTHLTQYEEFKGRDSEKGGHEEIQTALDLLFWGIRAQKMVQSARWLEPLPRKAILSFFAAAEFRCCVDAMSDSA